MLVDHFANWTLKLVASFKRFLGERLLLAVALLHELERLAHALASADVHGLRVLPRAAAGEAVRGP